MLYSASQRRVLAASPLVFAAVATALLVFSISHRVVAITPITTVAAKAAAAAAAGSGGSGADNGALTPVATSYVAAVTEQAGLEMTPAPDTSHTMCHDMYCMAENAVCCRNRRFCCPKGTVCGFSEPLPTSRPKCLGVFDNTGKRVTVDAIRLLNTGAALNIVLPKNVPTPNTSGGKVVIDGAPEPKLEFVLENTEVTVNGKL